MLAGGRFTIPAESRYSPTEGEALAVAVALESSRYYTLGCPRLFIATDHKPLLSILNDRALDTIVNPRLIRLKERTLSWQFELVYVPGTKQAAADALSRRKILAGLSCLSIIGEMHDSMEESIVSDMKAGIMEMVSVRKDKDGMAEATVSSIGVQPTVITWTRLQNETKKDKKIDEVDRGDSAWHSGECVRHCR